MCPMHQDVKDDSENGGEEWYEWCIENWGTKWDIADASILSHEDDDELEIVFNTAWSPPTTALDFWKTTNTYLPTTLKYIEHGCRIQGTWEDGEHDNDLYEDNCWECVDCGESYHSDWGEPDVNDANGPKCADCTERC